MNDMSQVIIPKSDQVSADDFISGPRTYLIEGVEIRPGTEQPVSIWLTNEPRAWKPCKSMSRVLVAAWGPDAKAYVGRSVTLYRDPSVKWGGMEVGGIRVSHLSDIERDMVMALTATKGKRAPYTVKVLQAKAPAHPDDSEMRAWVSTFKNKLATMKSLDGVKAFETSKQGILTNLQNDSPVLYLEVTEALAAAYVKFEPTQARTDEQHGDQHDGSGPFDD